MRVHSRLPRQPLFILLGFVLIVAVPARAAENAARDSEERLKKDVFYLASDELEGRGPGTKGIEKAADYIADQFKKAGLKPGGVDGTFFQPFPYPANVLDEPARLTLKGPKGQEIELKPGVQFNPMGMGHAGKLTAPVVFAGYGITSAKPSTTTTTGSMRPTRSSSCCAIRRTSPTTKRPAASRRRRR